MLTGIRDFLIISTPQDILRFEQLLKDGADWGLNISCAVQPKPEGIAQAFVIGEQFIGNDSCALILGDNIFYGHDLVTDLQNAARKQTGATVFAYPVQEPERYGVVEFDPQKRALSIEEKPKTPKSRYAVVSGGSAISWYSFAKKILENIGHQVSHALPKLISIATTDYPLPAKRPQNSGMSCEKLMQVYGLQVPFWDDSLALCLNEMATSSTIIEVA